MDHDLSKGKILITGASGFIGSAVVWALNERGLTNLILADFLGEDEKFKNLIPLRFEDYLEADTLMEKVLSDSADLKEVKTVIHLGACSCTTERNARYLIQNNYEYTKDLAKWALKHKARFVYASSAATYGDGALGMDDMSSDISRLRPLNMYGYSKHLFDLYAQKHGWLDKMAGMKYFNVFGPNEHHKADMRSVVHKAYHQIKTEGRAKLFKSYRPEYKDGEQMRDFLYVKDAVEMTLHLAQTSDANGLFNLGSGEANTWLTLVEGIFEALGKTPKIDFIEMPETLKAKYQYYTRADITKIKRSGYQKAISPLKESVKDYIQSYLVPEKYLGE